MKRKSKQSDAQLDLLNREAREIDNRIHELEATLKRPRHRTMNSNANTMPPPDRVIEGAQNRALRSVVARNGRAANSRRDLRENYILLILLICAVLASFFWIIRLLEQQ